MSDQDNTPVETLPKIKSPIKHLIDTAKESRCRIPWVVYEELRMNSFEREAMLPYLDDEAICRFVEVVLSNIRRQPDPSITYNDILADKLAPLLVARLREVHKVLVDAAEAIPHPDGIKFDGDKGIGVLSMAVRRLNRVTAMMDPEPGAGEQG